MERKRDRDTKRERDRETEMKIERERARDAKKNRKEGDTETEGESVLTQSPEAGGAKRDRRAASAIVPRSARDRARQTVCDVY